MRKRRLELMDKAAKTKKSRTVSSPTVVIGANAVEDAIEIYDDESQQNLAEQHASEDKYLSVDKHLAEANAATGDISSPVDDAGSKDGDDDADVQRFYANRPLQNSDRKNREKTAVSKSQHSGSRFSGTRRSASFLGPQLSEMDSGILMEEVNDDSTAGRKLSPHGAAVKEPATARRTTPSHTESRSYKSIPTSGVHRCSLPEQHHKFMTFSSQQDVEISERGTPITSDFAVSVSSVCPKPKSLDYEFDDSGVKGLADVQSESLRYEITSCRLNEQQTLTPPSWSRYHTGSNSSGDCCYSNDLVVIDSDTDADEPASSTSHLAHTATGIVLHCLELNYVRAFWRYSSLLLL